MAGSDPDAKARRAEMLLEIADTQQFAKQYKDAANTYEQFLNEKSLPDRTEELTQRLIVALHLAGEYPRSDQVANQFLQQFPGEPAPRAGPVPARRERVLRRPGRREAARTCPTARPNWPSYSTRPPSATRR